MSFFFTAFVSELSDINKKQSFVGLHTKLPKRISDTIALSEDAAYGQVDPLDKWEAGYVRFYAGDTNSITSPALDKLHGQRKALLEQSRLLEIEALEQAMQRKTKTCSNCGRLTYLKDYQQILHHLKNSLGGYMPRDYVCGHCRKPTLPITVGYRKKLATLTKKREDNHAKIDETRRKLYIKAEKKGELTIKALIGAWLHESLEREYDDEY